MGRSIEEIRRVNRLKQIRIQARNIEALVTTLIAVRDERQEREDEDCELMDAFNEHEAHRSRS